MTRNPRRTGIATAGLLTAVALILLGQPASAAPPDPAAAARGGPGHAAAPAAVDGTGPSSRAAGHGPATRAAEPGEAAHRVPNPLLKEVLGEEDEGESEDDPALSALCQSFVGKPNPYRPVAPNVDQIVGDSTVTVGSQAGCSSAQNETSIAVNPFNPRNIVAGANDYRVFVEREQRNDSTGWAYTSFDGGRTWKNQVLPGLTVATGATGALTAMDSAGDPVIAFGPRNTVYYGNIVFSRGAPADGGTEAPNGIVVSVSHDGGAHWDRPTIIQLDGVDAAGNPTPTTFFNDKIWMAADKLSGRVYVTWTRFADTPDGGYLESPIVVSASTDFGRSFGAFRRVDTTMDAFTGGLTPFSQGSNPQVGRDGTLYIAYEGTECATLACDGFDDRDVTVVARSTDHGRTFRTSIVDTNFDFPVNEELGTPALTGENFRINSYPQLAYDPVTDSLAVSWNDDRNGRYTADGESIRTNGDNIVAGSRGGRTWSVRVIGTPQDEVFSAVATIAGLVAVSSYTRHYDPRGVGLDYAYWKGFGVGSLTRAPIRRITTQTSDPRIQFVAASPDDPEEEIQGVFIGDYTAMAVGADLRLHPCWTDFRGRPGVTKPNQDAYTQSISLLS
ncbi:MAG TPA: sialidase family protein [Mycobacteriales bacterium]|nr:sialidase family protein [Mycobacteriales bacterium]